VVDAERAITALALDGAISWEALAPPARIGSYFPGLQRDGLNSLRGHELDNRSISCPGFTFTSRSLMVSAKRMTSGRTFPASSPP
jgi:hypothetical protein